MQTRILVKTSYFGEVTHKRQKVSPKRGVPLGRKFYIHSPNFLMYTFFAIIATKQYKIGTPIITVKYRNGIATSPIICPNGVNGNIIAIMLNSIDEKYTILCALLCTNGILAVLITCIPTRFDTTPYENHIVWNTAASLIPNMNQTLANTIISKHLQQ